MDIPPTVHFLGWGDVRAPCGLGMVGAGSGRPTPERAERSAQPGAEGASPGARGARDYSRGFVLRNSGKEPDSEIPMNSYRKPSVRPQNPMFS